MANHYGVARTNFFKVKDPAAFRAEMEHWCGVGLWEGNGYFGLYEDDGDGSGFWPTARDDEDDPEVCFIDAVAEHLAEGQVAVFMNTGAEKLRYVTGHANAVGWNGEVITIDLDDIYILAEKKFGVPVTQAVYGPPE